MTWPTTSRHARGYGNDWDKLRLRILARDKHLCQPCRAKGRYHPADEVDHVIPKAKGGTDDEDNLQAICTGCHKEKTADESGHSTHPDWLKPSAIPLTILCGPPCSGKTTYIEQHAKPGDVIIDLDTIRMQLDPTYLHWTAITDDVLMNRSMRARNAMLGNLCNATQGNAWFIVSAPTKGERKWWAAKLGGEILLLDPGRDECKRRAAKRGTPNATYGVDRWYQRALQSWDAPKVKVRIGLDGWPE